MKFLLKKDSQWINDHHGFLPIWKVVILYSIFSVLSLLMGKWGIEVTAMLNPGLEPGSQAFIDYLNTEPLSLILMALLSLALTFGIFYLAGARFFGPEREKKPYLKWIGIGLILQFSIQLIDYFLNNYGLKLGLSANQEIHNQVIYNADFWRLAISMGIIPAIEEEIVMRGLIQRFGFSKWPTLGILFQALIFAGMHYTTNPIHAFLFGASGAIFG